MFPLDLEQFLLAALIVVLACAVQGSVGFGMAMLAAPLLLWIDRALVPGPVLVCAGLLGLLMARREGGAIDKRGVAWAIGGRLLGTPPAVFAMQSLSSRSFDLFFALLVMLAVVLSVVHPHVRPTARWVFSAGAVSGFMGTISSIGGPPLALVYQNSEGSELRATLSCFFFLGCSLSLLMLSWAGFFGQRELLLSLALAPAVVFGFWLSRFTLDRLRSGTTRLLILALSFASAAGLLLGVL